MEIEFGPSGAESVDEIVAVDEQGGAQLDGAKETLMPGIGEGFVRVTVPEPVIWDSVISVVTELPCFSVALVGFRESEKSEQSDGQLEAVSPELHMPLLLHPPVTVKVPMLETIFTTGSLQ